MRIIYRAWFVTLLGVMCARGAGAVPAREIGIVPATRAQGRASPVQGSTTREDAAKAQGAELRLMALQHPNPYVRETAYHDHDRDWAVDSAKGVFSVIIRDPDPRTVTGVMKLSDKDWVVKFDDEKKLADGWTPPADAKLTAEQTVGALSDMCARWDFEMHLKWCGTLLKDAVPVAGVGEIRFKNETLPYRNWRIDLKSRTFHLSDGTVDVFHDYDGMFGWDKQKRWTAWPLYYTHLVTQSGIRSSSAVAIRSGVSPAVQAPPANIPDK